MGSIVALDFSLKLINLLGIDILPFKILLFDNRLYLCAMSLMGLANILYIEGLDKFIKGIG